MPIVKPVQPVRLRQLISPQQKKALAALDLARQYALQLRAIDTPVNVLVADIDHDEVYQAIEHLADACFEARDAGDFEDVLRAAGLTDREAINTVVTAHGRNVNTHQLAAFAVGVAWGRLEGGA